MSVDFDVVEEEILGERVGFREGFKKGEVVGLGEFGDEGETEGLSWVIVLPVENYTLAYEPSPTQTILILVPCDFHFHFTKLESMDAGFHAPVNAVGSHDGWSQYRKRSSQICVSLFHLNCFTTMKICYARFSGWDQASLSRIIIVFIESYSISGAIERSQNWNSCWETTFSRRGNVSDIDHYF